MTQATDKKAIPFSTLCYKCKKEKAVINVREKACKTCFLSVVEYIFKNTLREKCHFKNKTHNGDFYKKKYVLSVKRGAAENKNTCIQWQNQNIDEEGSEIKNKKKTDDEILIEDHPIETHFRKNIKNASNKKHTIIAFSGGICSCFLLFCFIQYLKNYKNQENGSYLINENTIFKTILYVDVDENEEYVENLENVVRYIWEITQNEENICSKKNRNEKPSAEITPNNHDIKEKGEILKKRIGMADLVILKGTYFVKSEYKKEFRKKYRMLRDEKNNYYLNYIKEIIILNNILKYCINENVNYVLFGNSGNNISEKVFLQTLLGNGINIPLNTSYVDNRFVYNDVQLLKPLKDMFNKEIYIYSFYKNIKYLKEGKIVNILKKYVEEIISNLHEKNNSISVINNTANNLLDWHEHFNKVFNKEKGKISENVTQNKCATNFNESSLIDLRVLKMKHFRNCSTVNVVNFFEEIKNAVDSYFCFICLGNKETEEQKTFIKKMDKNQKENLSKMKYTDFTCSTCCSIFSSSTPFAAIYDFFF